MKPPFLIALICVLNLNPLWLQAQNYRPFQAYWTYVFDCEYYPNFGNGSIQEGLYAMKVDSTASEGADSLFYFNQIGRISVDGIFSNQDNLFGRYMRETPNGEYAFYLSDAHLWAGPDTYYLKTQVPLQTSWIYHINDAGDSIIATLADRREQSVLGITDSVIQIDISTGNSLIISKNYGFVDARALFPVFTYTHQLRTRLQLAGIENLGLGIKRPRLVDFYDYEVGEVYMSATSGICDSYDLIRYEWRTILERNIDSSSTQIHYKTQNDKVEILSPFVSPTNDWDTLYYEPDTFTFFIPIDSSASKFPTDRLSHDFTDFLFIVGPYKNELWGDRWAYRLAQYNHWFDPFTQSHNNALYSREWVSGIGLTYDYAYTFGAYACLQCAIKQNETLGAGPCFTPSTVSIDTEIAALEIEIYPNPTNSFINFSFVNSSLKEGWSIELFDSFGERLFVKSGQNQAALEERIDMSNWASGIYLLRFQSGNYIQTEQIVKY